MPWREGHQLGLQVIPKAGESGMSLLLRAFQANGVHYADGVRWLGLDRRQGLSEADVATLAWALRSEFNDLRDRFVVLENRGGGRWVHLAGQRLSRWVAPTTMLPKVCPDCLRETGVARISWMTRAIPACRQHGRSMIQTCAVCGRPLRWARPAVRVCQCGRYIKPTQNVALLGTEVQDWLCWVEATLHEDEVAARQAMNRLPPALHGVTLDGAYRLVEAFGLLGRPGDPVRNVRSASTGLEECCGVLVRGLRRLFELGRAESVAPSEFDAVYLTGLSELVNTPAAEADGSRAAWLLDVYRALRPSGLNRVGTRPRRQMPLFL